MALFKTLRFSHISSHALQGEKVLLNRAKHTESPHVDHRLLTLPPAASDRLLFKVHLSKIVSGAGEPRYCNPCRNIW